MAQFCKKVGFILLVLVISAGFYWFLFMDRAAKQDALTYTLDLLGTRFIELVSDKDGKKSVETLYRDFVEKAQHRQIPPENIEFITANILNLSNLGEPITTEKAEALLKYSFAAPVVTKSLDSIGNVIIKSDRQLLTALPDSIEFISTEQWDALAIKIKTLHDFNSEMQSALEAIRRNRPEIQHQMKFTIRKNMIIAMDSTIRQEIYQIEVPKLRHKIEQLEKVKLLEWRDTSDHN